MLWLVCLLLISVRCAIPAFLQGCQTPIDPPYVPATYQAIRSKFFTQWQNDVGATGIVYLEGGRTENRQGTDTEVKFRQESNFYYLTGIGSPDFSIALDMQARKPILFVPKRDEYWAIWNGVIETLEEIAAKYGIPDVMYDTDRNAELRRISSGKTIYLLPHQSLPGFANVNHNTLNTVLPKSRVTKTPAEIQLMAIAANVSSDAHIACMKDSKAGLYEFSYSSYFQYYTESCGLLHQAYLPITAAGSHSAILHYNVPLSKVDDNGFMLIDAGAEFQGYATDITRTFPVNGKFSAKQKLIYSMVLDTIVTIESRMRAGVRYPDMSSLALEMITRHLLEADLIRGTFGQLMSLGIGRYFFPHGLGHSVGIDVHDPGSISTLQENMVVTVEPGIYFNEVYLQQGMKDRPQYFNIPLVTEYLAEKFGGVRIEDTMVVTATGVTILSNVPKTIEAIEQLMNNK